MNVKVRGQRKTLAELKVGLADYLQGKQDCREGLTPIPDASESYLKGYGEQYCYEQVMDGRTGYDY